MYLSALLSFPILASALVMREVTTIRASTATATAATITTIPATSAAAATTTSTATALTTIALNPMIAAPSGELTIDEHNILYGLTGGSAPGIYPLLKSQAGLPFYQMNDWIPSAAVVRKDGTLYIGANNPSRTKCEIVYYDKAKSSYTNYTMDGESVNSLALSSTQNSIIYAAIDNKLIIGNNNKTTDVTKDITGGMPELSSIDSIETSLTLGFLFLSVRGKDNSVQIWRKTLNIDGSINTAVPTKIWLTINKASPQAPSPVLIKLTDDAQVLFNNPATNTLTLATGDDSPSTAKAMTFPGLKTVTGFEWSVVPGSNSPAVFGIGECISGGDSCVAYVQTLGMNGKTPAYFTSGYTA